MNVHETPSPERALSVRQTPPPAAAIHTVQLLLLQAGSMASAVTRPDTLNAAPLNVSTAGSSSPLGPASVQTPCLFLLFWDLAAFQAVCAVRVKSNGT